MPRGVGKENLFCSRCWNAYRKPGKVGGGNPGGPPWLSKEVKGFFACGLEMLKLMKYCCWWNSDLCELCHVCKSVNPVILICANCACACQFVSIAVLFFSCCRKIQTIFKKLKLTEKIINNPKHLIILFLVVELYWIFFPVCGILCLVPCRSNYELLERNSLKNYVVDNLWNHVLA